jgi:hypothetical protein
MRQSLLAIALASSYCVGCSSADKMPGMADDAGPGSQQMDGGMQQGDTVTLTTDEFEVPAGGEIFVCQDFANPFGDVDTEVKQIDSEMTTGSHHMLLFFKDGATNTRTVPCAALQFSTMLYGAQSPSTTMPYPAGVAALIKGTQGFHMQMHYLNASKDTAFKAHVTVRFQKATAGTIQHHAGVFFFNNVSGIQIPANTTMDVSASCTFKRDVQVIFATAHTHRFSNSFEARVSDTPVYNTDSWDNAPNKQYAPPIAVGANDQVTWKCNVTNPSTNPGDVLTFGESANTNEMCIFDGQYYPADDADPTIDCTK